MTISEHDLAIFSARENDRQFLRQAFHEVFGSYLNVYAVDLPQVAQLQTHPKVVIVTITSREYVQDYFPDSKHIYVRRTINGSNLEELIKLPKDTKALVVNQPEELAMETIETLYEIGIHHLDLRPWWPSCSEDTDGYDIVIYPGFRGYCPEGKGRYINIGDRHVSQQTLVQVIKEYDLPAELIERANRNYIKLIIDNCYRLESSLRETEQVTRSLQVICNLSGNALIAVDEGGTVTVFNPAAEALLKRNADATVGRHYWADFSQHEALVRLIQERQDRDGVIVGLGGQQVVASVANLNAHALTQTFVSLMPVETLQGAEAQVRRKLHSKGFKAKYRFDDIVGNCGALRTVKLLARHYAKADATVLISGESGTGKELFAQSIHNESVRAERPFVAINFAALPESLAESELFGYEDGAFTGASKKGKAGIFETAHGGTIFLDEVGDASLSMQTKLLRVLEEREIFRIGSNRTTPIDVRVICATNKDLMAMVRQGTFREDLYYRLRVLTLKIPPLRERKDDIARIAAKLAEAGGIHSDLLGRVLQKYQGYDWPGNVRELKSVMQFLSLLGDVREPAVLAEVESLLSRYYFEGQSPAKKTLDGDLLPLLYCIDEMNREGVKISRYSLAQHPALRELGLTETMIRTRLKKLEGLGYVSIGKTKQGAALTDSGQAFIRGRAN